MLKYKYLPLSKRTQHTTQTLSVDQTELSASIITQLTLNAL